MTNLVTVPKVNFLKTNCGNDNTQQSIIELGNLNIFYSYTQPIFSYDYSSRKLTYFKCDDGKGSVTTNRYRNQALRQLGLDELTETGAFNKALETGSAVINGRDIRVVNQRLRANEWK